MVNSNFWMKLILQKLEGEAYCTVKMHNPNLNGFYPRDARLARVFATATCLSVRLSRAGFVSKQRKLAS